MTRCGVLRTESTITDPERIAFGRSAYLIVTGFTLRTP
jgi:hypothetical protein